MANHLTTWQYEQYGPQGNELITGSPSSFTVQGSWSTGANTFGGRLLSVYDNNLNEEVIFVYLTSGWLYAIRASGTNNSYIWRVNVGTDASGFGFFMSLSDNGDAIYCGHDDIIKAFNTTDGTELWNYTIPSKWNDVDIISHIVTDKWGYLNFVVRYISSNGASSFGYLYLRKLSSTGTYTDEIGIYQTAYAFSPNFSSYSTLTLNSGKDNLTIAYTGTWATHSPTVYYYRPRISSISTTEGSFGSVSAIAMSYSGSAILNMAVKGLSTSTDLEYFVTSDYGLSKYDFFTSTQAWRHYVPNNSTNTIGPPVIDEDGIIYYRSGSSLYSITDNGSSSTLNWEVPILPTTSSSNLIIGSDSNIYIFSSNATGHNVHVYDTDGDFVNSYSIQNTTATAINKPAIISENSVLYLPISASGIGTLYFLGNAIATTTTTTTDSPTTTTTTTPLGSAPTAPSSPLKDVITQVITIKYAEESQGEPTIEPGEPTRSSTVFVQKDASSASDNDETVNTVFANSLNFGTIAPGETSENLIISLNIPFTKAITNIKLGLIDTGDITFANNIFGITSATTVRTDITPSTYFQGVNTDDSATNQYNVSIPNNTATTSDYVYLNISLPRSSILRTDIVRLKWYFDYAN